MAKAAIQCTCIEADTQDIIHKALVNYSETIEKGVKALARSESLFDKHDVAGGCATLNKAAEDEMGYVADALAALDSIPICGQTTKIKVLPAADEKVMLASADKSLKDVAASTAKAAVAATKRVVKTVKPKTTKKGA